jgi:hypothetical protein
MNLVTSAAEGFPARASTRRTSRAMLAIGLDIGVARITYGIALPAFAPDLQLSLTAAGLLGTLHLIGYLLGDTGVALASRESGRADALPRQPFRLR